MILAIIGTEGMGKTTLAAYFAKMLRSYGHATAHLDGDVARTIIGNGDYSDRGRNLNAWTLGGLTRGLSMSGHNVLVSAVFPLRSLRRSFQHACREDVFWVLLEGDPFITREHGRTTVEDPDLNTTRCRVTVTGKATEEIAGEILRHVTRMGWHWLSVIATPSVVKEASGNIKQR